MKAARDPDYNRNRFRRRRANAPANMCRTCCIRPKVPGYTTCKPCREYSQKWTKKRWDNLSIRTCHGCFVRPALPGKKLCEKCVEKRAKIAVIDRQRRRKNGLCVLCGNPLTPWAKEVGERTCAFCRMIRRD